MLFIKALMGALITLLLDFLSKSKNFFLAGLVPLFPIFALLGQFLVYQSQGADAVKKVAIVGMLSLIPYFLYLLGIYVFISRFFFPLAVLLSLLLWSAGAFVVVKLGSFR